MAEPKVSILLTLVDKLTAPAEGAKKSLSSFGDQVTGLGAKIAALAASAALGAFFKSAVAEAIKAEQSTIRLGHAVRNAGQDFDDWAPQIDATITRLTKLTTYSDDDLSLALGNLITKTGDVAGSLENMGLVTDLAANRNIGLEESATLVAKAINGGGRLFKEYGITAGTAAEKTAQLADILAGSAAVAADSFGGRVSNLGKAWGEFKEGVGEAIISNAAIGDALGSLTVLIDTLAPKVASFVEFIVWDVTSSIQRFVEDVQLVGAGAARAILGVPDRFKLAWGELVQAIANTIGENRVLMTVFGDGLTKVADKMGASGDRMVSEAKKNLRNLDAGYKEVVASIGQTVEKGEDDKTKTTRKGHALRLDDEEKAAKDKKAVWDGSANVFIDDEKARAAAAKEADRVIRSSWGLSSDYILSETAKVVTAHRAQAAALATIVDGMDGVYGSSTTAAPAVEAVGDEVYNAARGAVSLANEFGTIDDQAASVLNNVINLADTLKDGLKGIAAGNLIGAVGALAGILGTMFSDGPQEKARRELILKNTQRLQELKDRMGELLNISTPGGKITKFQGLNEDELIATSLDIGPNGLGQKVGVGQVGQFLAKNGLSLTDMRQMAADFGIDLGDDGKNFTVAGVRQFFKVLNSGQFVGFGNDSFAGKLDKNDFLNSILGVEGDGALASMAELFKDPETGSSAFASIFDGVNLADGVDDEERALMRGRLGVLAQRFASGAIGSAELGGLSNTDAQQVFTRISDMLGTPSAATGAAPAGAGLSPRPHA